jgi:hypothetical protein
MEMRMTKNELDTPIQTPSDRKNYPYFCFFVLDKNCSWLFENSVVGRSLDIVHVLTFYLSQTGFFLFNLNISRFWRRVFLPIFCLEVVEKSCP